MESTLIQVTEDFVKEYMSKYDCSHDWHHVERVVKQSIKLSEIEGREKPVDTLIVRLAALLHDIDDEKYRKQSEEEFSTTQFLIDNGLEESRAELVSKIVKSVSFRGELRAIEQDRLGISDPEERRWRQECVELFCVQDADRLDAIGAFGILRCAAFSGVRNRPLHDPADCATENITYEKYIERSDGTTGTAIAHFYEKLLKISSMMKTREGKIEAKQRHDFMLTFLNQVDKEYTFAHH